MAQICGYSITGAQTCFDGNVGAARTTASTGPAATAAQQSPQPTAADKAQASAKVSEAKNNQDKGGLTWHEVWTSVVNFVLPKSWEFK